MSYDASMFYIKNISLNEHNEFLKNYNYLNRLAKSKEKLEKLKEDFV